MEKKKERLESQKKLPAYMNRPPGNGIVGGIIEKEFWEYQKKRNDEKKKIIFFFTHV